MFSLLEFPPAPILLGLVLGPLIEENFRSAMLLALQTPSLHARPKQEEGHGQDQHDDGDDQDHSGSGHMSWLPPQRRTNQVGVAL